MGNMSYCRFQNTARDLNDCYNHLDDGDLSKEEQEARTRLIELSQRISDDYGEEEE